MNGLHTPLLILAQYHYTLMLINTSGNSTGGLLNLAVYQSQLLYVPNQHARAILMLLSALKYNIVKGYHPTASYILESSKATAQRAMAPNPDLRPATKLATTSKYNKLKVFNQTEYECAPYQFSSDHHIKISSFQ